MNESLLEMYLYETSEQLAQLEAIVLQCEKTAAYPAEAVAEIFRLMHSVKGSSAVMSYTHIATLAHQIEDLFALLRSRSGRLPNCGELSDCLLACLDFVSAELGKIRSGEEANGESGRLITRIHAIAARLSEAEPAEGTDSPATDADGDEPCSRSYEAVVFYADDCQMANVRAIMLVRQLLEEGIAAAIRHAPEDLTDHDESCRQIQESGLRLTFRSHSPYDTVRERIAAAGYLSGLSLNELPAVAEPSAAPGEAAPEAEDTDASSRASRNLMSVHVHKLDRLMDLVGELVVAESMVTQHPGAAASATQDGFHQACRQLRKITGELQDLVMSIRMVPVVSVFQKMQRIVRDMSRKLDKEVELRLEGEETEVDRRMLEQLSDPLMHLVRNAIDHGIETAEERAAAGKPPRGALLLEAKATGGEVQITVKDDGRGLNKATIVKKAREKGLLANEEDGWSDRDIWRMILLPGFSTKESASEFSGRGVGMDVVAQQLNAVRGSVSVESEEGAGTAITMRVPLTLAIIDGMTVQVGSSYFTLPTASIRECFRPSERQLLFDSQGAEMILVRGECLPVIRLSEKYRIDSEARRIDQGILVIAEEEGRAVGVFADALIGQQQIVVKGLPDYLLRTGSTEGLAGCTLLGDGSISLILDVAGHLTDRRRAPGRRREGA